MKQQINGNKIMTNKGDKNKELMGIHIRKDNEYKIKYWEKHK